VKGPLRFVEVGPRDGLQNESAKISVAAKVEFIDLLSQSGLREIEVGAFVSPKALPQMADSLDVFENIKRKEGVIYSALVPNEEGLARAIEADVDKIAVFTAASETFNQKNINTSIAKSLDRFRPVVASALKQRLPVRGYISTAFHCPYEGPIKPESAVAVADRLLALGVTELSIGDTVGKASPPEVRTLLKLLLKRVPAKKIYMHFHDTYGMAVANALVCWEDFGITGFDASTGGLGGCPYAPGASGNVAMEDLLFAFQASGAEIPVEIFRVQQAADRIKPYLDHPLNSKLSRVILRSFRKKV